MESLLGYFMLLREIKLLEQQWASENKEKQMNYHLFYFIPFVCQIAPPHSPLQTHSLPK